MVDMVDMVALVAEAAQTARALVIYSTVARTSCVSISQSRLHLHSVL